MKHLNAYLLIACSFIISFAFSSCKQDLQVSDVKYYALLHQEHSSVYISYLLENNRLTEFVSNDPEDFHFIDEENYSGKTFVPTDYYIEGSTHYEVGFYDEFRVQNNKQEYIATSKVYIKINGIKKCFNDEPPTTIWPKLIPSDEGIYVFFDETYPTGETDRLGNMMYGHTYKVSKDGAKPMPITTQIHSELGGPLSSFSTIKKYKDKFYFVGKKDKSPYFCDSGNLQNPFILSMDLGEASDFCKIDTTFLVCGVANEKACIWAIDGLEVKQSFLPVIDETMTSYAYVIKQEENDIYVGGRIGDKPAIWKNGEIYGIYEEFPPHQIPYFLYSFSQYWNRYSSGCVGAMEINGERVYSIVITDVNHDYHNNMLIAVEWDFSKNPISCKSRYDLVEMTTDGTIKFNDCFYHSAETMGVSQLAKLDATYWETLTFPRPRIVLQYLKDK